MSQPVASLASVGLSGVAVWTMNLNTLSDNAELSTKFVDERLVELLDTLCQANPGRH